MATSIIEKNIMGNIENLIIEITDEQLKVCVVKQQKRVVVPQWCVIRMISHCYDELIKDILIKLKVQEKSKGKNLVVILPRRFICFKQFTLPTSERKEMRKMIYLQIGGQTPYAREDVCFNFSVCGKNDEGHTTVLVAIVAKEILERYCLILNSVGLRPHQFSISSMGVMQWFLNDASTGGDKSDAVLLIDIDFKSSDICLCVNKKLVFSRRIKNGAFDLQKGTDQFLKAVDLTFHDDIIRQNCDEIKKVLLLQSAESDVRLMDEIKQRYGVDVETYNPFFQKEWRALSVAPGGETLRTGSVIPFIGFAFKRDAQELCLVLNDVFDAKKEKQERRVYIQFALALMLFCVMLFTFFGLKLLKNIRVLDSLEQEIEALDLKEMRASEDIQLMRLIAERQEKKIFFADIVNELMKQTPEGILFQEMNFGHDQNLRLKGFSDDRDLVNMFQRRCEQYVMFENVKLQYVTQRLRLKQKYYEFEIKMHIAASQERI